MARAPTVPTGLEGPLGDHYLLRSVWLEDFENGESGWFSFLERRDRGSPAPSENGVWGGPDADGVSVAASRL